MIVSSYTNRKDNRMTVVNHTFSSEEVRKFEMNASNTNFKVLSDTSFTLPKFIFDKMFAA
jgi:hypothetical protein